MYLTFASLPVLCDHNTGQGHLRSPGKKVKPKNSGCRPGTYVWSRDAEPEPEPETEPPEPTDFGPEPEPEPSRSRSRSRQKRGGSGSEKGYNCGKKKQNESEITRNSRTNSLTKFYINNFRTSAINYLKFSWLTETCIWQDLNIKQVLYQVRLCHWPETSSRADSPSGS